MKFTKSIVAMAAISVGMMFAGSANANSTIKHTVQEGDTISGLAQEYHVDQKKIQKANKTKDINTIYVGEVFVFDGKGNVKVDKKSAKSPAKTAKATTANSSNASTSDSNNTDSNNTAASSANSSSASTTPAKSTSAKAATQAPAQQAAPVAAAPAAASAPVSSNGNMSGIAQAESGNDYNARNGQYIGKYQLSASYLNGDYSPANQEAVAQQYAVSRYGSVEAAAAYHASHGSW